MKKLATVSFQSWNGTSYLYDDCTGAIIPSSPLLELALRQHQERPLEEIIPELSLQYDPLEVKAVCDFIALWETNFRAFYRDPAWSAESFPHLFDYPLDDIRKYVLSNTMQLVLVVTENCNLRCRYCIFSEHYPVTRPPSNKSMSFETACRAVDYFFSQASPVISRIPGKKLAITFYGGEPLLEIDLIRRTVKYVEERAPCEVVFNISTNATLLNEDIADFLVEHNFNLAFSVDGPAPEHDRNRIFANGEGSFQKVWGNIQMFHRRHPGFQNILFLSVFDWKTNLLEVARFFAENKVGIAGFVNPVSQIGTSYYDQFTPEDYKQFEERRDSLWQDYISRQLNNEPISPFTRYLFELAMAGIFYRSRIGDARFPPLPVGGCCVPGMKIAVQPDGKFDICERVNGSSPIGHLDTGIDFERIQAIINEYNRKVTVNCFECSMSRLCSLCFALANTEGSFEIPTNPDYCETNRANNLKLLQAYCSIREVRPEAFSSFDHTLLTNMVLNR